jgi:hypothetical protein
VKKLQLSTYLHDIETCNTLIALYGLSKAAKAHLAEQKLNVFARWWLEYKLYQAIFRKENQLTPKLYK